MKFKKILVSLLVVLVIFAFVGCGEATTGRAVANEIQSTTDRLTKIVNNLDTATDDDLSINDISPMSASNTNGQTSTLTKRTTIGGEVNNGYSVNNVAQRRYSTGGTTLKSNSTIPLRRYYNNQRANVRNSVNNGTTDTYTKQISSTTNEPTLPSVNNGNQYTPRYVNSVSGSFTRNNLDNYIANIETLYSCVSDCLSASAEENQCKQTLQSNISTCKDLCSQVKSGNITLTDSQVSKCNGLSDTIDTCTSKINSTKGDLNSKVSLLKKLKSNYSNNMVEMVNTYNLLLQLFDTRIAQINTANDCVCQCNQIMQDSQTTDGSINDTTNNNDGTTNTTDNTTNSTTNNGTNGTTVNRNLRRSYSPNSRAISRRRINQNTNNQNTGFSQPVLNNQNQTNSTTPNTNQIVTTPNNTTNMNNATTQTIPNNTNTTVTPTPTPYNANNTVTPTPTPYNANGVTGTNNVINGTNGYGVNGYANGYGANGAYGNGYGANGYGINGNPVPRNIDTYRNIKRNIDTYGPNYVYPNNQLNNGTNNTNNGVNNTNNMANGTTALNNNTSTQNTTDNTNNMTTTPSTNNNVTNNNIPNNNMPNTQADQNYSVTPLSTNSAIKNQQISRPLPKRISQPNNATPIRNNKDLSAINSNRIEPVKQIINSSTQPNTVNTEGPLPNPFDPKKIEEMNNDKLNKESGMQEETEKTENETTNNSTENSSITPPKAQPLNNNSSVSIPTPQA